MLDFFRAVVAERRSVDAAAEEVLGERWPTLHDDSYVRGVAG